MNETRYLYLKKIIIIILWVFGLSVFAYKYAYIPSTYEGIDYSKHWYAAVDLVNGVNPYQGEGKKLYHGFVYPLACGYPYFFLAFIEYDTSVRVWDIINLFYCIGGFLILAFFFRPEREKMRLDRFQGTTRKVLELLEEQWPLVMLLMVASFQPLHNVVGAANIDPLNFFVSILFAALFLKGKDTAAGLVFAFFCLVKVAPIFLFLPLIAIRAWRVVITAGIALTIYGLFLLISGLWRWEIYIYTDVLPGLPVHWRHISFSVHRFVAEFLLPARFLEFEAYQRVIFWLNAAIMSIYAPLTALWFFMKNRNPLLYLAFGYFMVLLFTPLLELNHVVWVAPAIFIQMREVILGRVHETSIVPLMLGWAMLLAIKTLYDMPVLLGVANFPLYTIQTAILIYVIIVSGIVAYQKKPEIAEAEETTLEVSGQTSP